MKEIDRLAQYLTGYSPVMVLTGAGCSTGSGIPDYRDHNGDWKQAAPVQYRDFIENEYVRKRYWARSMNGWPRIASAVPNEAHRCLAWLESVGLVRQLVTQNVDGLHQKAGSRKVLDLHGSLHTVNCLACGYHTSREKVQSYLQQRNPRYVFTDAAPAADGDTLIESADFSAFTIPACPLCNGILKPAVVFFGESVPADRVRLSERMIRQAKCLLVIGSSLMLYSGYRFCRAAGKLGIPVVAVNLGRTRADADITFKIEADCGSVLKAVCEKSGLPAATDNTDSKLRADPIR